MKNELGFPDKKQTGRTTRMVEHAIEQAKLGRAVYILTDNERHAWQGRRLVEVAYFNGGTLITTHGIKVEPVAAFDDFDWQLMRPPDAHPNCLFLVDHFAIEARFNFLLAMWHRFDEAEGQA